MSGKTNYKEIFNSEPEKVIQIFQNLDKINYLETIIIPNLSKIHSQSKIQKSLENDIYLSILLIKYKNDLQTNIIETLKAEDETKTLDEINKLKNTISDNNTKTEDKNKAFDTLKILNQISSKEALLEEKVKNNNNVDSFIKIEDDQIKVVVNSENKTTTLANQIMRTIQENFDTKQYIVVEFK